MKIKPIHLIRLARTLVHLILAHLIFAAPVVSAEPHTLRISNGDWAPFMGKDLPGYGFVTRIATEAFKAEGIKVEYEFFPWARAYYVAQSGSFDASIGWYRNEARERDFLFSDPVFVERQVFFHLKTTKLDWTSMSDLKGRAIGATIGYTYGDDFKKAEESRLFEVSRIASDEQSIKMLLAGRVDAIVMSQAVGEDLLHRIVTASEANRVVFHPKAVNSGPLHLIFPKAKAGSSELLKLFNSGLAKVKARGPMERPQNRP